jgi:uncharacterized protein YkwD
MPHSDFGQGKTFFRHLFRSVWRLICDRNRTHPESENRIMKRFQRLISLIVAAALALPMSAFGESRAQTRTDMRALAEDLAAVLGQDAVETRGSRRTALRRSVRSESTLSLQGLVAEMNSYRAQAGLQPLRLNARLNDAASDRIRDMYAKRYFDHVAPDGTQPFIWARRHDYRYATIGENLAAGYPSAQRVVAGWMNSPGHRANILGRTFEDIGLAIADGFPGRNARVGGPTVVALYAREM